MAKLFESIGKLGLALAVGGGVVNSALFNGETLCSVNGSIDLDIMETPGFFFSPLFN